MATPDVAHSPSTGTVTVRVPVPVPTLTPPVAPPSVHPLAPQGAPVHSSKPAGAPAGAAAKAGGVGRPSAMADGREKAADGPNKAGKPAMPGGGATSVAERAAARLNSFGPFHGSANCLAEMRAQSPPRDPSAVASAPASVNGPSEPSGPQSVTGVGSATGQQSSTAEQTTAQQRRGSEEALAQQYRDWQAKHPSALADFDQLISRAQERRLAVFLDYDGTLSPIVEDPDRAFMSDEMRAVVKQVAGCFPTAIISGRGREKVYNFVRLSELYYAGSHGMDIMMPLGAHKAPLSSSPAPSQPAQHKEGAPDPTGAPVTGTGSGAEAGAAGEDAAGGAQQDVPMHDASCETRSSDANGHEVVLFQPAKKFAPLMEKVYGELSQRAQAVAGAWIENNNFCVTIHFRRVKEELWDSLADIVADVVHKYPSLRTTHGRKVLEIRPEVDWNKGKAVSYLLHTLGLTDRTDVMPIYIGDDRTDEDAFQVLKERGVGCGIVVAAGAKATAASFSLRDPNEVMAFLHRLVCWAQPQ